MLRIKLTYESGRSRTVTVSQAEFVKICPYCRIEFPTIDPDQIYCKRSHAVLACQVRTFARNMPRALATASIGISRVMLTVPLA